MICEVKIRCECCMYCVLNIWLKYIGRLWMKVFSGIRLC